MARVAVISILILGLVGCAVSAGGFSFSLLQDASVTLNTGSRDGHDDGADNQP